MAHFARVASEYVIDMHVLNNVVITDDDGIEQESLGQKFLSGLWGGDASEYIQCSYNGNPIHGDDRGLYPSTGYKWNGLKFIAPLQPAS